MFLPKNYFLFSVSQRGKRWGQTKLRPERFIICGSVVPLELTAQNSILNCNIWAGFKYKFKFTYTWILFKYHINPTWFSSRESKAIEAKAKTDQHNLSFVAPWCHSSSLHKIQSWTVIFEQNSSISLFLYLIILIILSSRESKAIEAKAKTDQHNLSFVAPCQSSWLHKIQS